MFTMTEARYDDVDKVVDKISGISFQELLDFGVVHKVTGQPHRFLCMKRAKLCKEKGFLKIMRKGEDPQFVFGAAELERGVYRTWFMGTESYFDPANRAGVRATAKAMASIAGRHPRHTFEARSASKHEAVLRWFGAIGFSFVEQKDGAMTFRYVGRNSTKAGKYANLTS